MRYKLNINGRNLEVDERPDATLLTILRDDLNFTGTRYGCGYGVCGACYVMMGGEAVASCKLSAKECSGRTIVTIEGIAKGGDLHPVQKAFMEEDAMQCGTCTGGMVISAVVLLAKNPRPTEQEIRRALAPHLCRCGIYCRAIRAVKRACR